MRTNKNQRDNGEGCRERWMEDRVSIEWNESECKMESNREIWSSK
uniref:Uncharacterized protein n=1 Tax=Nelumbo nucifera TaxID=4432 RepID=A0A822XSC1_NELNU|nr:TPA_asm: hypothetical protein HUJ06_024365 [Nelumbo nucifera]